MRRLLSSFRSKVIALTLVVALGSQGANMAAVLFSMNRDATVRAESHLDAGSKVLQEIMQTRGELLEQNIHPLAADPTFQAAIATEDLAAISLALSVNAQRGDADGGLLLDLDGSIVAASGDFDASSKLPVILTRNTWSNVLIDNHAYQILTVPVKAPNVIGWVLMGYEVNDKLAQHVASLSGLEVTFMSAREDGQHSLLGSSLSRQQRALIVDIALKVSKGADPLTASLNLKQEFLSHYQPLLPDDPSIFVLLQKPLTEAMAPYKALIGTMIHAMATTLLAALAMAFFLSRSVTRPIQSLLLAARRMRVGDYQKKLDINSQDEFSELAKAFDSMREGIAEREQRIVYQAQFDTLTDLPNRAYAIELLRDRLRKGAADGSPVAVMALHLQRFREIQSSLGHDIGDEVLRQTAQRLRANLPEDHILARLEGDQFLVIAPAADRDAGQGLARKLAGLLDAGLMVQSVNVILDVCIGLCICPEHGRQPDELLRRAAVAKNDAQFSHERIRIYQNGREARHIRQLAILGALRRAAHENELKLFLQPKITLHDTQICGAEALLRWENPELGHITPHEFIPLAENAGSISMVTEWVLRQSIRQAQAWRNQGLSLPISVNLSGRDLQNDKLPEFIRTELDQHGLDAGSLILEITEEAVVQDINHAIAVLGKLRTMGLLISMDDFGTGYSSLAHLQQLPVDELKIDRTFVRYLPEHKQNAAIVRAVIKLAHNLGLEVVAEGVETTAALRWLREEGCERAQGYYMSKPMPAELFAEWLKNWEKLTVDAGGGKRSSDSLILRPRLINS